MQKTEAKANGRVNLIGEHTDYNGGWVLPTAIPQATTVVLKVRADQRVEASTSGRLKMGEAKMSYELGSEKPGSGWIDYVQGATKILREAGHQLKGFDLEVHSDVPMGSGLSSSAALEIALLKALRSAFELKLDDPAMARIGQRIENDFVGAKVGIMDQMACALAQHGQALFLDTKTLTYEQVPLPFDRVDLVVINSGVEHRHSGGDYNQRRAECESACRELGISELRELTVSDLPKLDQLTDVLRRRARHVITENERVHQAVAALRAGDFASLGELFYASHASMRDDYQVSIPEIDRLVELCRAQPSTYGARLTGGGFGGSIVAIAHKGKGLEVARAVTAQYDREFESHASILVPQACAAT